MATTLRKLNLIEILNEKYRHAMTSHGKAPGLHSSPKTKLVDSRNQFMFDSPTINRVFLGLNDNLAEVLEYLNNKESSVNQGSLSNFITTSKNAQESIDKIVLADGGILTSEKKISISGTESTAIGQANVIGIFETDQALPDSTTTLTIGNYVIAIGPQKSSEDIPSGFYYLDNGILNNLYEQDNGDDRPKYSLKLDLFEDEVIYKAGWADESKNFIFASTNYGIIILQEMANSVFDPDIDGGEYKPCPGLYIVKRINFKELATKEPSLESFNRPWLTVIDDERLYSEQFVKQAALNGAKGYIHKVIWIDSGTGVLPPSTDPTKEIITMTLVGVFTGQYGTFMIYLCPNGRVIVKLIDWRPGHDIVINRKTKDNSARLVVVNDFGTTVFKYDRVGAKVYSNVIAAPVEGYDDQEICHPSGLVEYPSLGIRININSILSYWGKIDATIATIKTRPVDDKYGDRYIEITYHPTTGSPSTIYTPAYSTGNIELTKDYDSSPEFECLREYQIKSIASLPNKSDRFIMCVQNVGVVLASKTTDQNGIDGFRLKTIIKDSVSNLDNSKVVAAGNCFIAILNQKLYYISSIGECNQGLDFINLSSIPGSGSGQIWVSAITYSQNNSAFFSVVKNLSNNNSILSIWTAIFSPPLTTSSTISYEDLTRFAKARGQAEVKRLLGEHIGEMHNRLSVVTYLNELLNRVKSIRNGEESVYTSNPWLSYIALSFAAKGQDYETIQNDVNSPNAWGMIRSRTLDATPKYSTSSTRNLGSMTSYDTVIDNETLEKTDSAVLQYRISRLTSDLTKISFDIPTTFTFYVNNILGWSKGEFAGSTFNRKNLEENPIVGLLSTTYTNYGLVLNPEYFNIKNIIAVHCSLASPPRGIYSDSEYRDRRRVGMYDSPQLDPICITPIDSNTGFFIPAAISGGGNVKLDFAVFGGDALKIDLLVETYREEEAD